MLCAPKGQDYSVAAQADTVSMILFLFHARVFVHPSILGSDPKPSCLPLSFELNVLVLGLQGDPGTAGEDGPKGARGERVSNALHRVGMRNAQEMLLFTNLEQLGSRAGL